MVGRLRAEWHEGMSIPALIDLRDELDEALHRIRAGRNTLEKDWAAYRKQHRLDIEGRALVGVPQSRAH
jgi:hypothetical protein